MSLEQEIAKLREAIVELTAELRKQPGAKMVQKQPDAPKPAEKSEAVESVPAASPPPAAPKAVDRQSVGVMFIKLVKMGDGGKKTAGEILKKFNAPNVASVEEKDLAEFAEKFEEMIRILGD